VGVTTDISGSVEIDTSNPAGSKVGTITVDISKLKSDSGSRDNTIRGRFLESTRFPTATFTSTAIEGLPSTYTEGQQISFKVTGDLTVHEITKPVTFDVTATLSSGSLTGTATATILMSDFGIGPIKMAGILGTEDEVKLTFNFVARP
jgi:polyisoprenoid-binding protein YceI